MHAAAGNMAEQIAEEMLECKFARDSAARASLLIVATGLVDSSEAFNLNLVRAGSGQDVFEEPFNPAFTYPIFGEDEKIFGYKDLKISLRFRANDMRPHVHTTYSKKLKPAPGVEEPTDVVGVLDEGHHLPKSTCDRLAASPL